MTLREWLGSKGHSMATVLLPDVDWSWNYFTSKYDRKLSCEYFVLSDVPETLVHQQSIAKALLAPERFNWDNDILYYYDIRVGGLPESYARKIYTFLDPVVLEPTDDTTEGYNIWQLTPDDVNMLDMYKQMRQGTAIVLPDYTTITTTFSKLLYNYIAIEQDNNISHLPDHQIVQTSEPLLYKILEIYVRELVYQKMLNGEL